MPIYNCPDLNHNYPFEFVLYNYGQISMFYLDYYCLGCNKVAILLREKTTTGFLFHYEGYLKLLLFLQSFIVLLL